MTGSARAPRPLRVAFVVQGEGRGHFTQALALAGALRSAGHQVVEAHVCQGPEWPTPDFFVEALDAPTHAFEGPTLAPDREARGMSRGRTAWRSLVSLPRYAASMGRLARRLTPERFDVVVSFYDLLSGLGRLVTLRPLPAVVVGHHYLLGHPGATPFAARPLGRVGLALLSAATAVRSRKRLALSFRPLPPTPDRRLEVVPPLLRTRVTELRPSAGDYLLAYALNPGNGAEIVAWQRTRPEVPVHLYIAGGAAALATPPGPGCHVHDLAGEPFLAHLEGCRALVTSAGFESLCEAHYLGKPVLAVPTPGQVEQVFNAEDARAAGVARRGSYGDLDDFWNRPGPPDAEAVAAFREWVGRAPTLAVGAVERAARGERA